MPSTDKLDTHHKALTLNLDPSTFGSFAEFGAGQEVARWFLVVGGASATVAKTISAYDKEVSDNLYGSGSRYVSKQHTDVWTIHWLNVEDVLPPNIAGDRPAGRSGRRINLAPLVVGEIERTDGGKANQHQNGTYYDIDNQELTSFS